MYSLSNVEVEQRYRESNALPSDEEYGGYIMREMQALGFSVSREWPDVNCGFVFTVKLLGGSVKAAFMCKSNPQGLSTINVNAVKNLCAVKGASLYGIITNNSLLGDKAAMYRSKGYFPYGGFHIGNSVLSILTAAGLVTTAISDFLISKGIASEDVPFERNFENDIIAADVEEEEEIAKFKKEVPPDMLEKYENGELDELLTEALQTLCDRQVISAGSLARVLDIGMPRANKILRELELLGVISASSGGKPRNVLLTRGMIEKRFGITLYEDWEDAFYGGFPQ